MAFNDTFGKWMMKNAHALNVSIELQFGEKVLVRLCSDNSTQTLFCHTLFDYRI